MSSSYITGNGTVTPISKSVYDYLPENLAQTAPTTYNSFALMSSMLPERVNLNYNLPTNPYLAKGAERLGWNNPNSNLNLARQEIAGASNSFKNLGFDKKVNTILGSAYTLYDMYNVHQQMKLAKDQLAHNKMESERNYQAQRKMTNSQLEDRQKRRVEEAQANGRSTTSVADYMAKYGV